MKTQFPNTVSYERDNDVPQWQHVPLQVPWFSNEELPVKEAAPLSNYSVGEEISPSVPIAIAWSPPGLAKYRRCALAVLTSNLVLSIWSAEGKLQVESTWNRRVFINHALVHYFCTQARNSTSHVSSDAGEQLRLKTRIRAFAWAPALPSVSYTLGSQTSYDQQFLVVANDDNELAFLAVDSPTTSLGSSREWSATVLTHSTLEPKNESIFTDPTFFDDLMKQQRFISHIAWSPWITSGDYHQSVVIYATNEDVRGRLVILSNGNITLSDEIVYPKIHLRHRGPITWCPRVGDSDKLTVALFTSSGLDYLTISGRDASIMSRMSHDLDGRWDQVSGAVWDCEHHSSPQLHFSSLLSTILSPTAVLEKSNDGLTGLKAPSWREKIENSVVLFSVKNDLEGYSKTKVWGLTSSPLGDFVAACNTLHPSDSIEYGPPADRRGTVALSTLHQYSKMRERFPAKNVTAEGVLWTLKKLVENTVEDADQMPAFAEEAVSKLMQAYGPILASDASVRMIAEDSNLRKLVEMFKVIAIFDENTLRDRYGILVSYACNDTSSNELLRTLISYRLATAIQKLPLSLFQTPFSAEVLSHQKRLLTLISDLLAPENEDESAKELSIDAATAATDQCDFCAAPIPFTDLTTATCTNGHQFPRCGLSLLAIQAPGITKYCGICNTPFLSEEFVQAQEAVGEETEHPVTLSRVLFQACDVCMFCGGKFVG
ncbi:hypothetical protein N0V94_002038 [Neodidymelliopsis sp. IMI 364377]|nr:hypothetical protein N0V94_002038 [Neodidymelliopsis sp. IMI 364377]